MGLSSTPKKKNNSPAATGIRMVLYANAQNRFCFAFRIVAWLRANVKIEICIETQTFAIVASYLGSVIIF